MVGQHQKDPEGERRSHAFCKQGSDAHIHTGGKAATAGGLEAARHVLPQGRKQPGTPAKSGPRDCNGWFCKLLGVCSS